MSGLVKSSNQLISSFQVSFSQKEIRSDLWIHTVTHKTPLIKSLFVDIKRANVREKEMIKPDCRINQQSQWAKIQKRCYNIVRLTRLKLMFACFLWGAGFFFCMAGAAQMGLLEWKQCSFYCTIFKFLAPVACPEPNCRANKHIIDHFFGDPNMPNSLTNPFG